MYQQEVNITVFDGGITPKQLQDIASSGDPNIGELYLVMQGTIAWMEDGCIYDLEEVVDAMTVREAVDSVIKLEEYIKTLQEVADELKWEAGYIEGKKGSDFYNEKHNPT